jgi:hypothetical protein
MWPCDLQAGINLWAEKWPDRLIQRILPSWNGIVFQSTAGQLLLFNKSGEFEEIKEQG